MNTMKKRILSCVLATAAVASMSVTAFAAGTTTVVTGSYDEPVMDVVVPADTTAVINPYGLGTSVKQADNTTKVELLGQIVSLPMAIKNKSTLDLSVGAKVTTTVETGEGGTAMKLEKATTKGVEADPDDPDSIAVAPKTSKSAFIEMQVVAAPNNVKGADDTDLQDAINLATAATATWEKAKSVVLSTASEAEGADLAVMKKATMKADGTFNEYDAGSIALVRLTGDCVASPKVGTWTEDDKFKATIVFSFSPAPAATPAP